MQRKLVGILVVTLLIAATVVLPVAVTKNVSKNFNGIPPITDLSGCAGPNPEEVTLNWNITLFENPNPEQTFDPSYDFRYSDVYIDNSNWNTSNNLGGDFNAIVALCVSVDLDLWISPQVQGTTVQMDQYLLKAWLTVQFDCGNFYFPGGHGLEGETIIFEVYDPDNNLICYTTDETNEHGMACRSTDDLYDGPPPCSEEKFHFKAYWAGHSIGLSNGFVISTGDREDSEDEYVCDGTMELPSSDHWSPHGGIYHGTLGDTTFEFTVPPGAISDIVEVMVFSPSSVPPSDGMSPGVPGHMLAFQLEKQWGGPHLNKPIVISVDYSPELLDQYGGLGESSLRGYRYYDVTEQWILLDDLPLKLNREHHRIGFETDQLGLFAIAAETDTDNDGLGDYEELDYETNPDLADSDGDGIIDGDEAWFTFSDPNDPRKKDNDDQYGFGQNLAPGTGYYIAVRIVSGDVQSPMSNCIYVETEPGENEPDLECDGPLTWADVKPGGTVTGNFTVENVGDSGSELDWEVSEYPGWGTWTFAPEGGDDLTPKDGATTIQVSVVAPEEEEQEFSGNVKIVNKENSSDFCTIQVSLATPKNKATNTMPLFLRFLELYPHLFPLLRQLLEL